MKTSQRGLEDIIFSEGEVLHAYADELTNVAGNKYRDVLTIGVGHTSAAGPPVVTPGMTITHAESRDILAQDIRAVEDRVMKAFDGKAPPQTVFDGAVSFDFNTGGILRASWPTLWMKGDMAAAEKMFLEWNKPPEIVTRRKREADLIFRGQYHLPANAEPRPPPPVATDPIDTWKAIQTRLAALGLYSGPTDGDPGPKTRKAILDQLNLKGLP